MTLYSLKLLNDTVYFTLPTTDFNASEISQYLSSIYKAARVQTITNGTFCFVNGIKIDLLAYKYPLLEDAGVINGVRLVSLKDIGAMKLNAIYGNGSRLKDFVDMYALLELFSLKDLLEASEKKYPENNTVMVKNSLIHFEDIDFSVPIDYVGLPVEWPKIAERLKDAFYNPELKYSSMPDSTRSSMENQQETKKLRTRGKKHEHF